MNFGGIVPQFVIGTIGGGGGVVHITPGKEILATFNWTSLNFQQRFRDYGVLFYFIDTGFAMDL